MFTQDELKWLYGLLDQITVQGIPNKVQALNIMVKIKQMLHPPKPEDTSDDTGS